MPIQSPTIGLHNENFMKLNEAKILQDLTFILIYLIVTNYIMSAEQKPGANERDLSLSEVKLYARDLIQEFRKALLKTPEFKSAAGILYIKNNNGIANLEKVLFSKGSDVFEVLDSGVTEEEERLALSVSSKGVLERVSLVFDRRDIGSFILYKREKYNTDPMNMEKENKNDTRAVEGAKKVLAKLNHRPLWPL